MLWHDVFMSENKSLIEKVEQLSMALSKIRDNDLIDEPELQDLCDQILDYFITLQQKVED